MKLLSRLAVSAALMLAATTSGPAAHADQASSEHSYVLASSCSSHASSLSSSSQSCTDEKPSFLPGLLSWWINAIQKALAEFGFVLPDAGQSVEYAGAKPAPEEPHTHAPDPVRADNDAASVDPLAPGFKAPENLWFASHTAHAANVKGDSGAFSGTVTNGYHLITTNRAGETVNWEKPVGIVVRLHGDGRGEYDRGAYGHSTWEIVDEAIKENMIVLLPATPDTRTKTWWQPSELTKNRAYVTSLVDSISSDPAYPNINRSDIFWYGYSGGAEFLGYDLLTHGAEYVTSGALLTGGGGAPTWHRDRYQSTVSHHQLSSVPVSWVTGENDLGTGNAPFSRRSNGFNAVAASRKGFHYYCGGAVHPAGPNKWQCDDNAAGYTQAELEILPGEDHYSIDAAEVLAKYLPQRARTTPNIDN
ncbi:hypothetical protein CCYS_06610 [Corynebacterium cystitidis DSM 20524]|uniref:Alpha/beta hydrolase family protein n=1 Tax=Corynebacterium cystitidis DSM 20524 TaxID=1121357 RepID=A0A1H9S8A9_9CORY|nr:hypothetical protein CCYS_06610 [Corynebacterium cystitidis DSM 20524]SER81224.1 hypothetical protein SAMN05661109_01097 [Corynebacterium cystitidis DSM 20524]SNV77253.1 putative secreted protein [Corynebacterium cystitidis]